MTKCCQPRTPEPPVLPTPTLGPSAGQFPPDPPDPPHPSASPYTLDDLEADRTTTAQLLPHLPSPISHLPTPHAFPILRDLVARIEQSALDYQLNRITWADLLADIQALHAYTQAIQASEESP